MIKLVYGAHKPHVAFLNKIKEQNAGYQVCFGYLDDKPKICFDKPAPGRLVAFLDKFGQLLFFLKADKRKTFKLVKIGFQQVVRIRG